ncbi:MAG: aspartate aminotransferase family protein [Phycisphaeraceae bacterium]|nr:aspartate aminotransferase family protein [Phycisphaeraceae bacterium]MCB9848384.1 aspartate aminotransferase family protein [Phycisphaeraceae bacterium]
MGCSQDWLARRDAVVTRGLPRITGIIVDSAHGAIITDIEGREYIDFAGGIGVMNVGHCDPEVVEAIREQAGRLTHICAHVATYTPYVELCEKLATILPHGDRTKCILVNSGAEAVENAIKIARQATKRPAVICYGEAFHGRTLLCTTMTSKVNYKRNCGPFAPEIYRMPYPDVLRGGGDPGAVTRRELDRLEHAFHNTVAPQDVAAIIIELVQGEGGFRVAPKAYIEGLRRLCDKHGIMLIFDEVQSGFARTGAWGAYQRFGVTPDLSTWAKSMGGGMPIGAVVGKASVMDAVEPGTVGTTYGGNPIACAAALATIRRLEQLSANDRAEHIGQRIRERLGKLQSSVAEIIDVRGLGGMVAMELALAGDPAKPATDLTKAIVDACHAKGLIVIRSGIDANVIRFLPPLVITDEQLDKGLSILEEQILQHVGAGVLGGAAS